MSATGGGPFQPSPLNEVEEVKDRMLLMTKGAAPSGITLGVSRPSRATSSTAAALVEFAGVSAIAGPVSPTPPSACATPNSTEEVNTSTTAVVTPSRAQRRTTQTQTFQHRIADSAKIQADAIKALVDVGEAQAKAMENLTEAAMLQADAANSIAKSL
ncbi:uncharacterized protein [Eurosta solidaginis]|uniref:uncharacterized protein n=1 Tax=Eurosta solidaginis TaxID=178769 RepID=UPI003531327B